jgi:cyd operon protein YbgE
MTETAIPLEHQKPNRWLMYLCFSMALPLAGVLLIHPAMMLDSNGHYNHSLLMLIMIGISGGFIYGIGFVPRFWLWRWIFSPIIALPLMMIGYYIWILT